MDRFEKRFSELLKNYQNTLVDRRAFKGILSDYFPGEDTKKINALLLGYDLKIHTLIDKNSKKDKYFKQNQVQRLIEEYGVTEELAKFSIDTWIKCYEGGYVAPLKTQVHPIELKPKTEPEQVAQKAGAPVNKLPKRVPNYICCGVGKQDFGFYVKGLKEAPNCNHPLAHLYAVVFAYFQRSLEAKPSTFIKKYEQQLGYKLNYGNVFRLQILILLIIKNNYSAEQVITLAYDGDTNELDAAAEHINYYAQIFAQLAGIEYEDIMILVNNKSSIKISLNSKNATLHVENSKTRVSHYRMAWYANNLKYKIDENSKKTLLLLLEDTFGFKSFKPGQFEVLSQFLNVDDRHSICIMPTGAGKSLIFYFVALLRACPTFVLCPTELLIKDQILNLKQRHHLDDVLHLTSNLDYSDFAPENKLIYLTPKTFIHHQLIRSLIKLNYHEILGSVILDEVHCISNWSHDFRPEYLMLSYNLKKFVDKIAYLCFTATANYTVIRDIQRQLGIEPEAILSPVNLKKEQHSFYFKGCLSEGEVTSTATNLVDSMVQKATAYGGKTLIFTKNSEVSKELKAQLGQETSPYVDVYHSDDERSYLDFAQGHYEALIASSDLGVGINLPEVTETLHYGLPLSKSQFVQELGRAGRGEASGRSSVVYFSKAGFKGEEIRLIKRNISMEELITLANESKNSKDILNAFYKISGGIENQRQFTARVKKVLDRVKNLTKAQEVTFEIKPHAVFEEQVEGLMRYLYILYRTGVIHSWYLVNINSLNRSITFFVDPLGTREYKANLRDVKEITCSYLHNMGNYKRFVLKIKEASSVEAVIEGYVEWYYQQFLYHHHEQLLEMLDFLEAYSDKEDDLILQALSNYFSLSLVQIEQDSLKANTLTIKEITRLILDGVEREVVDNFRKSNENEYSPKLDYFLFGYNLIHHRAFDLSRLERVLEHTNKVEFIEILDQLEVYYPLLNNQQRFSLLKLLNQRESLRRIIDAIYSKVDKDKVYYGIVSLLANKQMGESKRCLMKSMS